MSSTLRLKVRYGRELLDIELPPHDCTLNSLQSKLELLTTVKPSHQRLIGPKGVLIKGKLVSGNDDVQQNNKKNDDDADGDNDDHVLTVNQTKVVKSTPLSEIGIKNGMQLLLVGAKALTQNNNTTTSNNNTSNNKHLIETKQYADLSNLLVVPQPDPQNSDTTLLKCSFSLGYVNQAVYVCMTCLENGTAGQNHSICSSCANVCHEGHECVYWGIRRATRCDCCTSRCIPTPSRRAELLTNQDAAATVLKARCKFLADETTHVAPSLPLPPNEENIYPPFPNEWCACEMMTANNSNNNDQKEEKQENQNQNLAAADNTDTHYGQWVNTSCVGCGQNYWTKHLENLSVEAMACQPCQGSQTSNAVAFYCRTCSGFTCSGCRLHCHKHHDIDFTPYLFSSLVGGFVDPLREPKQQQQEEDDEQENDEENENDSNRQEYFSCCCGGRCSIVGQVPLQTFYQGMEVAKEIVSHKKPEDELAKRDETLLHPSARFDKTVLRDPLPQSNAALFIDDYSLFVCGPCSKKNLNSDEGFLVKSIFSKQGNNQHESDLCFSKKNSNVTPALTDLIASSVQEQKSMKPCCLYYPLKNNDSDDKNNNNNVTNNNHGTLLPQIYFEWLRVTAKIICRCRDCDIRFEKQLPGARRLDEGPIELSVLVGGRCSGCKELLEADGTYLCMTCERDQQQTQQQQSSSSSSLTATDEKPSCSYELCKNCHETRRTFIHPADHEFELQTLGNTLRQVFALVDAEGDAATRQWLREQLHDCQDPVALLETIVSMMTGQVRLEDSERSLRETASMTATSYDDYSDEDDDCDDDDLLDLGEENETNNNNGNSNNFEDQNRNQNQRKDQEEGSQESNNFENVLSGEVEEEDDGDDVPEENNITTSNTNGLPRRRGRNDQDSTNHQEEEDCTNDDLVLEDDDDFNNNNNKNNNGGSLSASASKKPPNSAVPEENDDQDDDVLSLEED